MSKTYQEERGDRTEHQLKTLAYFKIDISKCEINSSGDVFVPVEEIKK